MIIFLDSVALLKCTANVDERAGSFQYNQIIETHGGIPAQGFDIRYFQNNPRMFTQWRSSLCPMGGLV